MANNYNDNNEIIKKQYENYLSFDSRLSNETVYKKIKSVRKYEEFTGFKGFKTFNDKQALAFKENYKKHDITYKTMRKNLKDIQEFLYWLASQSGYKKSIKPEHIKCLNLTNREENMANITKLKEFPTLEQINKAIDAMPRNTEKEKRDRAIIAYCILTGARISALMSLKIKSIDEYRKIVKQDPTAGVNTKNKKYIATRFFNVGDNIEQIALNWLQYLKEEKGFGMEDYLFTAMKSEIDEENNFKRDKLSNRPITSDTTIRSIFKDAFENTGMQYYNPHSFRNTLIDLGYKICKTPEEFKAWSQNIGHKSPLTTFTSYGQIDPNRQMDIIAELGA